MVVYIASKTKHAPKWKELRQSLKPRGIYINSTWIDEAGPGESKSLSNLAERCIIEAREADLLILYAEEGDVLKGALVEMGAALCFGVPVVAVGEGLRNSSAFTHHPLYSKAESVKKAIMGIIE